MSKSEQPAPAKLDLIVTHYKEPWSVGQKFFSMLDIQRGINFDDIRVLIVHDGTEPFPEEAFTGYPGRPYHVDQIRIAHGGISAARNAGIRHARAPWLMFCDFDDMFSNVYALRDYLTLLPNDKYNMMWAPFIAEDLTKDGETVLNRRGHNLVFIHGKIYRRQYLLDENLTFDESLEFNEDSCFNAVFNTICDPRKIGEIKAPSIPYIWCFNRDSLTTTRGNRYKALIGLYERNKRVVEAFRQRLPRPRYCAMIARACVDAYFMLNLETIPDELKPIRDDFIKFYHDHRAEMWETDAETLRQIKRISRLEHETGDNEEVQRFGNLADNIPHTDLTVTQWLQQIWKEGETD